MVNVDGFCEKLPEISSSKIFDSGKFFKEGLFSQQIFGPVKSYCCACSKNAYKGRGSGKSKCDICGVDITTSEERRKRFAKIALPFEVLNPMFYYMICTFKPSYKVIINELLSYKYAYKFDKDGFLLRHVPEPPDQSTESTEEKPPEQEEELLEGLSGVLKVIEKLIENNPDKEECKFINQNIHMLKMRNVIIIPPDFRPCGKSSDGFKIVDKINHLYISIIIRSNYIKDLKIRITEKDEIYRTNFKNIQSSVLTLYDYVLDKMSKKKGLIRSSILGKRVDFSGRAVISPDPTLRLNECGVPYFMLLEMMKPQLVSYLINRRVKKRYNQANKLIDDCIETQSYELFDYVDDFCKDQICVLNRQPTLHRLSILAFKIKPSRGNTIQIHPMVCDPYNADFDGDAMAIYFPVTDASRKDVLEKIMIENNLLSPTDLTLVPVPNQDIILGIWAASSEKSEELVEYKGHKMTKYQKVFNMCLPDDYPVQLDPCNRKKLIAILNNIAFRYPKTTVLETLDKIKVLGFELSSLKGYTLSIKDLYSRELSDISNSLMGNDGVKERSKQIENIKHDMSRMNDSDTMKILKSLPVSDFIDSGARGSWDQCKQLVLSRGYVSDANGVIKGNLIRSSLVQGLSQSEFFNSSWGARKSLLDTATSTGDAGYLTRQLIYSTVGIELGEEDDCGTTDTLDVVVPNNDDGERMVKTLLGRYMVDDNGNVVRIKISDYKNYLGKTIKLRSPIFCKSKKICKKCYGDLYKLLHSDQVGIIATQAVGERTTQLVLRTFHTGGVAQAKDQFDSQEDIISGITIANKLFHSPGKLVKSGEVLPPSTLVKMIYNVFNPYKGIHMVHYEIIISSMMFNKNKELWRTQPNRVLFTEVGSDDKKTLIPGFEWVSILKVPAYTSWLLGAAFSNLKTKLLDGIIRQRVDESTAISELFKL
jgi:DNA-directed RNA polymerase subunit beta'